MSSSKLSEEKHDWYAILGCSLESTKSAIEKAARKLFLKYHPDKTTDPKAPELFLLVQKAKEILLDDEKRKAIDEVKRTVAKREEYDQHRNKNMDVRRKRMREELEEKMGAAGKPSTIGVPSSSSGSGRHGGGSSNSNKSSNIDLERLRKEGASLRETSARDAELREAQRIYEIAEKKKVAEHEQWLKSAANQIKVKWKRSRQNHSDDSLYQLFKDFGSIEAVTLVGDKGNAALITFTEHGPAIQAVDAYAASTEYRVTLPADEAAEGKKRAAIFTHVYADSAAMHKGPEIIGASKANSNNESDLMQQMRRAVEREHLIRALGEEELRKADNTHATANQTNAGTGVTKAFATTTATTATTTSSGATGAASGAGAAGSTASLAVKEADVLQRMIEAAKMKKLKLQESTAANPS